MSEPEALADAERSGKKTLVSAGFKFLAVTIVRLVRSSKPLKLNSQYLKNSGESVKRKY